MVGAGFLSDQPTKVRLPTKRGTKGRCYGRKADRCEHSVAGPYEPRSARHVRWAQGVRVSPLKGYGGV
jgi:hypothetical protein